MKLYFEESILREKEINLIKEKYPSFTFTKDKSEAEVLFALTNNLNNDVLDEFKNLKILQLYTAGFDTLDLNYLKERNVKLLNAKDTYSIAISEDVINKMLLFNKNTIAYHKQQQEKVWKPLRVTHEIYGSTVGIIGAGSIGIEVAKRLKAFETKIIGYKRTYEELPYFDEIYTDNLNKLYAESDYIIISIASNKHTKNLLNLEAFKKMKKKPLIINVARGDIIDEDALIYALENDLIRGAGLDVTKVEPLPQDSKLWILDNVYITPHSSNVSPFLRKRLVEAMEVTLNNILNKELLVNEVKI